MNIISTNLAKPTTIVWNGKEYTTGIFKIPTENSIYLGKEGVTGDEVSDRRVHGGEFKACYLFSEMHYKYWKTLYPDLDWTWGMFGENLTISNLDETKIYIGDTYRIGEVLVQITQPRQPCFKFGVKFGTIDVLQQFVEYGYPGTYIRILEEGHVKTGDTIKLVKRAENSITVAQHFKLLYSRDKNQDHLKKVIINEAIPPKQRNELKVFLK
ncbi:MOSC domain-containing protein [uncultured Algibacter sp.]|uniref:MOSC domain-containing protein n=1 Tax=uncultured Algibacter sp. TaxID=298659 RepID=UPI003217C55F